MAVLGYGNTVKAGGDLSPESLLERVGGSHFQEKAQAFWQPFKRKLNQVTQEAREVYQYRWGFWSVATLSSLVTLLVVGLISWGNRLWAGVQADQEKK